MKQEKVYKIVKDGSLVKVKDSFGVIVSSSHSLHNINYSTNDPYLYKVEIGGSLVMLIREAFDVVQEL